MSEFIACIADFIKNAFVILSFAAFCAYVWRRGPAVCWHKFVNAGILGKDQRHRVLYSTENYDMLMDAIEKKDWLSVDIRNRDADKQIIYEKLQMFILNKGECLDRTTNNQGDYLDILTKREVSTGEATPPVPRPDLDILTKREVSTGKLLRFMGLYGIDVYIHSTDKAYFHVRQDICWQYIRTPSLLAKLFGEK